MKERQQLCGFIIVLWGPTTLKQARMGEREKRRRHFERRKLKLGSTRLPGTYLPRHVVVVFGWTGFGLRRLRTG